jgi:hypothetical protein
MKTMKKILPSLLLAIFFWPSACRTATGQDAPVVQSDQITGDGQQIIEDDDSSTGTRGQPSHRHYP